MIFTDLSTNFPTAWNWSFGDGSLENATQKNPVHTYLNPGSVRCFVECIQLAGSNILTRIGYINVTNATTNLTSRIGVYQNGQWILDNNGDGAFTTGIDTIYGFGGTGYTPVVGDWNGSSLTKIGVYQNGQWILDYNGDGAFTTGVDKMYGFGGTGFTPVVGDWNANNSAKIGVYQNGQWILDYDGDGVFTTGVDKIYGFGGAGIPR